MPPDPDRVLADLVAARARPEGLTWLDGALADAAAGRADLAAVFPAVSRQLGRGGLDAPGATVTTAAGEELSLAAWRVDDAARVRLLLAAARHAPDRALALARELYDKGDARERAGALRALSLLPGAARDDAALPAVLDALRVTQGELFEAAVCDSPYASRHLPQLEWRKAVLKAAFIGLSITRIARLHDRCDAELSSSVLDFAREREAAGRPVPPALWPLAARYAPPGLGAKLLGYLEHPAVEHRRAAAEALGMMLPGEPRLRPFLVDHGAREPDEHVVRALREALAS